MDGTEAGIGFSKSTVPERDNFFFLVSLVDKDSSDKQQAAGLR